MKRVLFILCSIPLLLFSPVSFANAQETSDFSKLNPEDYTNISLPPLDLLFENAKGGPIYELASVKEQIERKLLAKERRAASPDCSLRGRGFLYGADEWLCGLGRCGDPHALCAVEAVWRCKAAKTVLWRDEALCGIYGKTHRQKLFDSQADRIKRHG